MNGSRTHGEGARVGIPRPDGVAAGAMAVRPSAAPPQSVHGRRCRPGRPHYRPGMVITPLAGLLLGFGDFLWIKYVPFPVGGLGNSPAVWAVAAFLLTWR